MRRRGFGLVSRDAEALAERATAPITADTSPAPASRMLRVRHFEPWRMLLLRNIPS
jgi:hypothetical protein